MTRTKTNKHMECGSRICVSEIEGARGEAGRMEGGGDRREGRRDGTKTERAPGSRSEDTAFRVQEWTEAV